MRSIFRSEVERSALALSGGFRFSLALDTRFFVVFTLPDFSKHARTSAGTLKTSQCTVQGFILFYTNLRQVYPSPRSDS